MIENSRAFQRRDHRSRHASPEGTAEIEPSRMSLQDLQSHEAEVGQTSREVVGVDGGAGASGVNVVEVRYELGRGGFPPEFAGVTEAEVGESFTGLD